MKSLLKRIEALSPQQREILELRLKKEGIDISKHRKALSPIQPIRYVEKKEYYPLSSVQKRLYILQQLEIESRGYNVPDVLILGEGIEKEEIESTFRKLIERHESLRTSFEIVNDEPVQRIHDNVDFSMEYSYEPDKKECGVEEIIGDFIKPFDLSKAPLLRVRLIKTGRVRHVLLFDMHHIITDDTSQAILKREFTSIYAGEALAPLWLQYKDYAVWQNSLEQKELMRTQEDYWVNQFSDELPVLTLPTDYTRPVMQSFSGARVSFVLSEEETGILKSIGREREATLYMTLLSVFSILLSKLSGQGDIVIGLPVDVRRYDNLKEVTGVFINTLPMRTRPGGEKSFNEFLSEVKQQTLAALKNQEYQFEDLVDKLSIKRDTSRNPIFSVMFNLVTDTEYPGYIVGFKEGSDYEHIKGSSKFDIDLKAVDFGDKLSFILEYCTNLFEKRTIENIIGYFKNVIISIISDPGRKIASIELIGSKKRKEIISKFNEELDDKFTRESVQDKLMKSFRKNRDRIALEYGAVKISYSELEKRTADITNWLINNEIKRETLIGIFINDRIELISLMIGTLNAGCVFVPLDIVLPIKRVVSMINSINVRFVFTDKINKGRLLNARNKFIENVKVIVIDDSFYERETLLFMTKNKVRYNSEDKVYIYFTSGSMGVPRAILGKNKGLLHFIDWEINRFKISGNFRVSQFTNRGFDVFLRDIFVPLCAGGAICVPSNSEILLDSSKLIEWVDKKGIDLVHMVPTLFKLFILNDIDSDHFKSLKYILLAGEKISTFDVEKWVKIFAERIQLVSIYGPTETTLAKMFYFIKKSDVNRERIPIGDAIPGARIILLDKDMNICAQGMRGEIYIRTPFRSFGYLNNQGLNDARFISNPFDKNNCDLIYRTGDLGRETEDGKYEILGRKDRQVKINGIRVEPAEIEELLLQNKEIENAVVVEKEDLLGMKFLCAYIVSDKKISISGLRKNLSAEIPDYMIPRHLIRVDNIPLTPNGKVNRKALPSVEPGAGDVYIAPGNEIERKLTEIWSDVLGIAKNVIGVEDNFFEIGGHSLRATILTARIHKVLDVKVPLKEVFRHQTIRELARYIAEDLEEDKYSSIRVVEKREYYPQSSAQKRLFFLDQLENIGTSYNLPSLLKIKGKFDKERNRNALAALVRRHETLRTSFRLIENKPVQQVHDMAEFDIKEICSERRGGVEADVQELMNEFVQPFDLSKAPLWRVGLVQTSSEEYLLLYDMHHIIADGSSKGVLLNDFIELYVDEEAAPLKIQYKDFTVWQDKLLKSGEITQQEEYWLDLYSDGIPRLEFPTDYPRPDIFSFEGDVFEFTIAGEYAVRFRELGLEYGATLFMNLLAALYVLLYKYTGQEDFIIGSGVAGRPHADLQDIIGFFVNALPIRNLPAGEKRYDEFLLEVKENCLQAFENQDLQFERLIEKLGLDRHPSRNPLFDIIFSSQNFEKRGDNRNYLEGIHFVPYRFKNKTCKFDMELAADELDNAIHFNLEYSSQLYKKSTVETFFQRLFEIIKQVVENKKIKLKDINLSHSLMSIRTDIYESSQSDFNF